jgi:type I restriction enzyme S subunit
VSSAAPNLPPLAALQPNPSWASLPLFDRTGWKRVRFGDVIENCNETCDPAEAGIERVIAMEHLEPGSLHVRSWANAADGTTFNRRCRPGQVLFGKRRAYQRKVAVAEFEAVVSGDIYVLAPKDTQRLLPELLPFLCLSERFFQHAVGTSAGSLSPRTNWSSLASFEFDLPPLDQQRRIAEILWAVDEDLSRHIDLRDDAHKAYEAMVTDFFFGHSDKSQSALFNPKWKTLRLQEIGAPDAPIRYGIVQVGAFCEDGVPTVAIKNLSGEFGAELHKTAPKIEAQYAASRVQPGDLLLSIKASVGDVGIVPPHFRGNISRDLARIRCGPLVSPILLLHLFRSERYQAYITKYVVGSTRKEISIHHLRKFEIPVPPPETARDFVEHAERMTKFVAGAAEHCERTQKLGMTILNQLFSTS